MKNNKLEGERFYIQHIKNDKKEMAKDTALLAASALAVGVASLGIVIFGKEILEAFKADNAMTFKNYMTIRFQGAGVGISTTSVFAGILGLIKKIPDFKSSIKTLRADKNALEEIEMMEENSNSFADELEKDGRVR